ncbi:type II toxin-antitoxin system HicA family toxin [Candidatus Gottesmanbacteria bacterium]|nr:type II toxin-antitoxin system HicA family toxin [Candidatus Gottesmanbacteria bacterium]
MTKLIPLKPREVEVILLKNGFMVNRVKGSHKQFFHNQLKAHVTVPFHSKSIPTGTLRSIVNQSKLDVDLFRR